MHAWFSLLQWDEPGGVSSTDTGATVLHGLVGHGELGQVVTDHVGLWRLRCVLVTRMCYAT